MATNVYFSNYDNFNEQNLIDQAIDEAARCFEIWQKDDIKKAQNRLHSFKAQ